MPRLARLDAPGTLHHVIVRGIEKRRIVGKGTPLSNSITSWAQTKGQVVSYFLKGVPPARRASRLHACRMQGSVRSLLAFR